MNLPLTGRPAVECRSGGATGDHQIVVTFGESVTIGGTPQAEMTSGVATIGTGGVANGGAVTVSGSTVTIPLTGVVNAQTLTIALKNVSNGSSAGDVTIPMSVLLADVSGDGAVNSDDAQQTRNRSGQNASATNFRSDVNLDGSVNSADAAAVRSRAGTGLP